MPYSSPVWLPYQQMKVVDDLHRVSEAEGVYLQLSDGRRLIDSTASWWCMIHGYRHPRLDRALQQQAEKISHVMLGGLMNEAAEALAQALVRISPAGLNHVFYGDSGSVGVEIALKMAVQYWQNQGQTQKSRLLAFKKAYHGDTSGCMSVCDPDHMHKLFHGLIPQQVFAEAPRGGFQADADTVAADLNALEALLAKHQQELAAVIIEPLIQAAGGFNFYSPEMLKGVRALCDQYEVLLIADEVATGFGRTGSMFAVNQAEISPDILVLGKGLTGGYLGHSATLTNERVYQAFIDDSWGKCFMHGPTFMGNPLACRVALESLAVFEEDDYLGKIADIERHFQQFFGAIRSERIADIRVLGATAVVELHKNEDTQGLQAFALNHGVWFRPFDRYIYAMPPYLITAAEIHKMAEVIQAYLDQL